MIEDFVAFDFETASGKNPCSLGMVEYKNGKKSREFYELINPEVAYFNPFAIQIHGITYEDVQHERNFSELWDAMLPFIEGKTLVAHSAKFDNAVLLYSLQRYGIDIPRYASFCTLQRARRLVALPSYKLSSLANFFEVPQLRHHNALEDAFVCGELFLKLNRVEEELKLQEEHGMDFRHLQKFDKTEIMSHYSQCPSFFHHHRISEILHHYHSTIDWNSQDLSKKPDDLHEHHLQFYQIPYRHQLI